MLWTTKGVVLCSNRGSDLNYWECVNVHCFYSAKKRNNEINCSIKIFFLINSDSQENYWFPVTSAPIPNTGKKICYKISNVCWKLHGFWIFLSHFFFLITVFLSPLIHAYWTESSVVKQKANGQHFFLFIFF